MRFLSHGDSELFVCPTLVTRRKDIFLYFFTELKTYISLILFQNCLYFMDLRRMYAQDPRGSFRVDVFDSKEDYRDNFDETCKVQK